MPVRIIPAIFLLLSGNAALAQVKNPAGVASKGPGLEAGFLDTFPEYDLKNDAQHLGDADRKHLGKTGIKKLDLYSFLSKKPASVTKEGKVYLRFNLSVYLLESEQAASVVLDAIKKAGSESKTPGLSYAWDFLFTDGKRLYWLAAPCLYSDANFLRMSTRLSSLFPKRSKKSIMCRCGFNCKWVDSQTLE